MTKKSKTRICIYIKDVMILTGKSYKTVRILMAKIRQASGKEKHSFVTVLDFCTYTGITEEEVQAFLK